MKDYLSLSVMGKEELAEFISLTGDDTELYNIADKIRRENYDDKVYIRGLIEVSSYCKNNCLYCGIRVGNKNAMRYRLTQDEILSCCKVGYDLGFRTFVMQGGEDNHFTDEFMCGVIYKIKSLYPDCAITLSLGERSYESYRELKNAGADRYLLRHETANDNHYSRLHPEGMNLTDRKKCLFNLKELGYQVGSGFMVGSPYQTWETLAQDLLFLKELKPQMIGIGPFISHKDTPFKNEKSGSLYLTLKLISILRIMFPKSLIPATTALSSISPVGREMGLKAGANVVMPNLSPEDVRAKYNLYDNKAYSGSEAAESLAILKSLVENAGYRVVVDRGDALC
ncbi:MAG: [FeFe] hydrogenase H-cluster radical SAM maturase HydE [Clostridia bacterium]|nr:[FeFe] hydrogenase H-cluster radical SAM maturase HydE [Clostridia bacterium]